MLNHIWLGLLLAGLLIAGLTNHVSAALEQALGNVRAAVDISIGLVGVMSLWLGLMRLAEKSGLVGTIARVLRPVLIRVFPDVPADHPAMGSMVLNLAANMLGLNNAATPLGLRAMRDLETLNHRPGTATDAMCTFLALNTGSVQLIPVSAIALLAAGGSHTPTVIIGTTLVATACSSVAGFTTVKLLAHLPRYRLPPLPEVAQTPLPATDSARIPPPQVVGHATIHPTDCGAGTGLTAPPTAAAWATPVLLVFGLFFVWLGVRLVTDPSGADATDPTWLRTIHAASLLAVPFLLGFFPLHAATRGIAVYEEFIEGAKEGFQTAIRIVPYLVAIMVAIGFLRGAGGFEILAQVTAPILRFLGFPPELLPLALLRPLTGSGSIAALGDLVKAHGPDSLLARTGATLLGSTETTFYVIALYFGSVGIRRTRHAVWAGLAADFTGALAAVGVCRLVFGR